MGSLRALGTVTPTTACMSSRLKTSSYRFRASYHRKYGYSMTMHLSARARGAAGDMANQLKTAARPSGPMARQHSRPLRAELPTQPNTVSSFSPGASLQGDIDKLSQELGSVYLQADYGGPATSAQPAPSPTTKADSTTVQQPHQEPLVVRRSRRGERAISRHAQVGRYRVEITSSERLWCGKFALGISTEQQLGMRLTVEDFDAVFASEESMAFNKRHGWVNVENAARNFYDEQLDFVLRAWGRRHGLRLQLGVVRDFEGVFVNGALDDEEAAECNNDKGGRTTVWIHNDNAMLLGRPYNHYSGVSILDKAC